MAHSANLIREQVLLKSAIILAKCQRYHRYFAVQQGMQMKKLLSLLIGLSLSGFSVTSQAENLLQIYQQAKLSNPDLRSSAADPGC